MRIKEVKLYKFSELSNEAKDKAIEKLWDINVEFDWWNFTYEDAEQAGLKITGFDFDRGYCNGNFITNAEFSAKKIIEDHGENCETYKTAKQYLTELSTAKGIHSIADMPDEEFEHDDLDNEFLKSLLEDYRIILKQEYEFQTSKDAIIETIEANDYEFTEDGKLDK